VEHYTPFMEQCNDINNLRWNIRSTLRSYWYPFYGNTLGNP